MPVCSEEHERVVRTLLSDALRGEVAISILDEIGGGSVAIDIPTGGEELVKGAAPAGSEKAPGGPPMKDSLSRVLAASGGAGGAVSAEDTMCDYLYAIAMCAAPTLVLSHSPQNTRLLSVQL